MDCVSACALVSAIVAAACALAAGAPLSAVQQGLAAFAPVAGRSQVGVVQVQGNLRIAYVAQEPQLSLEATVFEAVSAGMARARALIDEYSLGHGDLDAMQSEIESLDGWNWQQRVTETLHRLHLDLVQATEDFKIMV